MASSYESSPLARRSSFQALTFSSLVSTYTTAYLDAAARATHHSSYLNPLIALSESSITHGPDRCKFRSHALLKPPLVIFSLVAFSYAWSRFPALTLASSTTTTSAPTSSLARRSRSLSTVRVFPLEGLPHTTIKHASGRRPRLMSKAMSTQRESRQPVRAFRFSPRLSLAAAPVPVVTLRRINTLGMHKKVVYPGSFRRTRRTDDCTFYFYVPRRFHWHESPGSPSLRDSPTSVLPVLPREAK